VQRTAADAAAERTDAAPLVRLAVIGVVSRREIGDSDVIPIDKSIRRIVGSS
jgi:hypothetical protein